MAEMTSSELKAFSRMNCTAADGSAFRLIFLTCNLVASVLIMGCGQRSHNRFEWFSIYRMPVEHPVRRMAYDGEFDDRQMIYFVIYKILSSIHDTCFEVGPNHEMVHMAKERLYFCNSKNPDRKDYFGISVLYSGAVCVTNGAQVRYFVPNDNLRGDESVLPHWLDYLEGMVDCFTDARDTDGLGWLLEEFLPCTVLTEPQDSQRRREESGKE